MSEFDPNNAPDFIPEGQYVTDEEQFGTPTELAKTAAEGVAQGVAGPIGTAAAIGFGSDPDRMRLRQQTNPFLHGATEAGGLIASSVASEGIAPVLETAGKGVTKFFGLRGVAGSAAKMAAEMAILSGGDEVSKKLMHDPDQSVGSAISNVGMSSLLGVVLGGAGGAVSPLWKATVGNKAGQLIEDFKGRLGFHLENPDPVSAVQKELEQHYSAIKDMADDVYGKQGLKAQDIASSLPKELHQGMVDQSSSLLANVDKIIAKGEAEPGIYQSGKINALKDYRNRLASVVESIGDRSPSEVFDAINEFKKGIQPLKKWGFAEGEVGKPVSNLIGDAFNASKEALEDSAVWGKAAKRQQSINKAFSDFLPTLKDFESKFTTKIEGQRAIDPAKINTYMSQLGKPNAEIKQQVLDNFLKAAERYKTVVGDTHVNLGIKNPIIASDLHLTNSTLDNLTPGQKLADVVVRKGLAKLGGSAIGAGIGGGIGRMAGIPGLGALIGEHALGPFFESVLPALTKPLLSGATDAEALKGAIDYGLSVAKGEYAMTKAAKNVFKLGSESSLPKEKSLDRLDKMLKQAQANPERMLQNESKLAGYFPAHEQAIAQTAMRGVNYLNSLRPSIDKAAPLDAIPKANAVAMAKFQRALSIAEQPLNILKHVKDGTIIPQDVVVLSQVHPGALASIQSKLGEALMNHVSKGGKVPYRTSLGISALLGHPMESSIMPQNIMQNQSVGMAAQSQSEGQKEAPKASKTALQKLSGMYNTPIQAREGEKLTRK